MAYTLAWLIFLLHMLLGGFLLQNVNTQQLRPTPAVLLLRRLTPYCEASFHPSRDTSQPLVLCVA